MTWSGSSNGPVTILQENLVSPEPFQLNSETCQDGIVYYAMNTVRFRSHNRSLPLTAFFIESIDQLANRACQYRARQLREWDRLNEFRQPPTSQYSRVSLSKILRERYL